MNGSQVSLLTQNMNHRMLLTIVFDNSASVKGEKIKIFNQALLNFQEQLSNSGLNDYVKYEIIGFKGLNITTIKSFDHDLVSGNEIRAGGIPFIAKAIDAGLLSLDRKIVELEQQNLKIYRPWLVLLIDGQNFDNLDGTLREIESRNEKKTLTYFPFLLGHSDIDESLNSLIKYKRPLLIVQNKYDQLFEWIFSTIKQRIEIPINQPAQLDFSAFDGWIQK